MPSPIRLRLGLTPLASLFVDHHPIAGGDKWREALRAAFGVGVWLASSEYFGEFEAAWFMGKRIVQRRLPQRA
jgi:hypothetical protein